MSCSLLGALSAVSFDFFNCLLLAGVIQGFLLCILLLNKARQQPAFVFLGGTLLIFALYNLLVVSADVDLFRRLSWLQYVPLNLILGFGPCIYFYVVYSLQPQQKWKRQHLVHFIPVMLQATYYLSLLFISALLEYRRQSSPVWLVVSLIEQWGGLLSVVGYTAAALRLLLQYQQQEVEPASKLNIEFLVWLKRLLVAYGCLWFVWLGYTVVDMVYYDFRLSLRDYYPIYLLVAGLTYWIGFNGYFRPPVITETASPAQPPQTTRNYFDYLPEEEIQQYLHRLQRIMKEQHPYLESEFSLKVLSTQTSITPNVISFLLNNRLGTTFSDWVNTFRVEEVKRRLVDSRYSHLTINGIALECGFNSKATFNRVFKIKTGLSPKEYLAAQKTTQNHLK